MDLLSADDQSIFCGAAFNCAGLSGVQENISCMVRGPKKGEGAASVNRQTLHLSELKRYAEKTVEIATLGGAMKVNICEVTDRAGLRSMLRKAKTLQLNNGLTVTVETPEEGFFGRQCTIAGIPGFSDVGDCGEIFISTRELECYKGGVLVRRLPFKAWNSPEEKEIASLAAKIYGRRVVAKTLIGAEDCGHFSGFVKFDGDQRLLGALSAATEASSSETSSARVRAAESTPR